MVAHIVYNILHVVHYSSEEQFHFKPDSYLIKPSCPVNNDIRSHISKQMIHVFFPQKKENMCGVRSLIAYASTN